MPVFLLTWSPLRYDWKDLPGMARRVQRGRRVTDTWSCARGKQIRKGDRLFMLRQGAEPRGIFGSGQATTDWYEDANWRGPAAQVNSVHIPDRDVNSVHLASSRGNQLPRRAPGQHPKKLSGHVVDCGSDTVLLPSFRGNQLPCPCVKATAQVNSVHIIDCEVNSVHLRARGVRWGMGRTSAAADARAGFPSRGGGKRLIAARAALARRLWSAYGERRVPAPSALDSAMAALSRGELEWICEFNGIAPIYLVPTKPFLRALAKRIRGVGARRVLEVAAGDGHLAAALQREAPDLQVLASDSGAWECPQARMNARERRELKRAEIVGIEPGPGVHSLEARDAIRRLRPDLVLASWLPPGPLLGRILRSGARWVLEVGAGSGITGDIRCWRYPHEFCDELDALGRCRLDGRKLHTRATLYGPL